MLLEDIFEYILNRNIILIRYISSAIDWSIRRSEPMSNETDSPTAWRLSGDYVEACNCDAICQCIAMQPPDSDVCTASFLFHIRDGRYGDIGLGGLSVGLLVSTDEGVMFAPDTEWDVVLLVDDTADAEQREAIEAIYFGRAGGIFAPVADAHVRSADIETVRIDFGRDGADFSVRIADTLVVEASGAAGFNDELGWISPHPLTADNEMSTGVSSEATVSYDDEFSWDVSGNNSYLGDFELANG